MLLASLVREERKVTRGFQVYHCQDQVDGMDSQAPLGLPGPLDSQATQTALWNASLDHQGIRVPPEIQGSQG